MTIFFMILHTLICVLLVCIILMQSGRGGGLTESFASAESMFGAQTSSFLIKGTTILASLFLVTCLSLAFLSTQKNKSLIPETMETIETTPIPEGLKDSVESTVEDLTGSAESITEDLEKQAPSATVTETSTTTTENNQ